MLKRVVPMRRLFDPGLLRTLALRTLLVGILPLLGLAAAAFYFSNTLFAERFTDEARVLATAAANEIGEKAAATNRTANLVAGLPPTRLLTEQRDVPELVAFLLPLKSRLSVDIMNVADLQGHLIAGAQDVSGKTLPESLLRRAQAGVEQAWGLYDEPEGVTIRAIRLIRGEEDEPIGVLEAGILLRSTFLESVKAKSDTELVLVWNGVVKASTLPVEAAMLPTVLEVDEDVDDNLSRRLTLDGRSYHGIFSAIRSPSGSPGMLGVLVPLAPLENVNRFLLTALGLLTLGLSVTVVTLAYRSAEGLTAPLRRLAAAAQRIQTGDLGTRVERRSQHEIGMLELTFNTMAQSLEEREREQKSHEARLAHMATHDALTGLPNRNTLDQVLLTAVAAARRDHFSALLYLDLDQFKVVNDTLGHASGDRLLIALGGLLRASLRSEDLLVRLGGDEFAAVIHDVTADQAVIIAEKLRRVIDDYRFSEGGQSFDLGVSIGVALIDGQVTGSELLAQADIACYTAKAGGRNKVELYRSGAAEIMSLSGDAKWSVKLKDALREDRFRLVFQPIVGVADGRVHHHEALIRLVEEDGSLTSPIAFIPAAERVGLIQDIDRWVLSNALDQISQELARGHRMRLAVNLSGVTVRDPASLAFIRQAIESRHVEPGLVSFEITETVLMTNLVAARRSIEVLSAMGCRFALDDFGSGFSSFNYLVQLPVDLVKIDGGYVRDLASNPVHQAVVRAINDVAHSMGKQTIGEWVEEAGSLEVLRTLGIDFGQGYYLGKPSEARPAAAYAGGAERPAAPVVARPRRAGALARSSGA